MYHIINASVSEEQYGRVLYLEYGELPRKNGTKTKVKIEIISDPTLQQQCTAELFILAGASWKELCYLPSGRMNTKAGLVYEGSFSADSFKADRTTLLQLAQELLKG